MSIEQFVKFDINFYAAFFLFVILIMIYIKKNVYSFSSNMFKLIIITNIVLLIFEGMTFLVDGIDTTLNWYLNFSFNSLVFLLTPLVGSFWASYIDHKVFNKIDRIKKNIYYLHPFIIGVVLSFLNLFFPVLFSVSAQNVYSREPLIIVNIASMYVLLFYILYIVIKNKKSLEKNVFYGMLLFMIFPAIGGMIQMLFFGVSSLFSMMALGVVATYILLETVGSSKDYLTNLFTRAKADEFVKNLIDRNLEFYIIMIDLDSFKKLNDKHGHQEGDNLLRSFGVVLQNTFSDNSLVSRFGGDEFFIIVQTDSESEILDLKNSIFEELPKKRYNNKLLAKLKFSYGYSFHSSDSTKTQEQLVVEADDFMYKDKAINKNYRRRKSDR